MNTYVVTFEINDGARKAQLKKVFSDGTTPFCPIHDNAFAIKSDKTSKEILNELVKITVNPDRIFVVRSGTAAAWSNSYGEKNSEWLKKNL